jgi:lysophospholipase L1-like esterase
VSKKKILSTAVPVYGLLIILALVSLSTGAKQLGEAELPGSTPPTETPVPFTKLLKENTPLEISFHDRLHLPFIFHRSPGEAFSPTPSPTSTLNPNPQPSPTHQPTPTSTPTTAPGCPVGMVSYWKLDESSGSTFSDSSGGNTASCSGEQCPSVVDGVISKGRAFDGQTDRLIVGPHPTLNWGSQESFTIATWVKMNGSCSGNKVFVGKPRDPDGWASWWLGCSGNENSGAFYLRDSNASSFMVETNRSINDGRWHHLAGVRDAARGELRIYLDGELESVESALYSGHFVNSRSLTLGSYGSEYHAPAVLDEIAVYRSALPAATLRSQYFLAFPYCSMCGSPVRIMPLGDSITLGTGDPDREGYRRFLYESLTAHGYIINIVGSLLDGLPDFDRDHEGHGGFHAAGLPGKSILPMTFEWLQANPADIVLLHIGTNDINDGGQSAAEVSQILDEIYLFDDQITVVLARIINRLDYNQPTTQYNLDLQQMADVRIGNGDKLFVVDMESALTYPDDMDDLLHPNISGYSKMGPTWETPLLSFLPVCSIP